MSSLLRAIVVCGIVLIGRASIVRAVQIEIDVTPSYMAHNHENFAVEILPRGDGFRLSIIRYTRRKMFRVGELKIQLNGRSVVTCDVSPRDRTGRIMYVFNISRDAAVGSMFTLYECKTAPPVDDNEPELPGTRIAYRFRIRDYLPTSRRGSDR